MEGTLSEIRLFGPTWAPRNWAHCHGQLMPISSNTALFSLIGTTYGGDGRTTFALPDLRGRVAIGNGTGGGLTTRVNGQMAGEQVHTLNILEMPMHNHYAETANPTVQSATDRVNTSNTASSGNPANNYPATVNSAPIYGSSNDDSMANDSVEITDINFNPIQTSIGNAGGSQAHNNMQPWLCTSYIICIAGVFPSRQ